MPIWLAHDFITFLISLNVLTIEEGTLIPLTTEDKQLLMAEYIFHAVRCDCPIAAGEEAYLRNHRHIYQDIQHGQFRHIFGRKGNLFKHAARLFINTVSSQRTQVVETTTQDQPTIRVQMDAELPPSVVNVSI